MSMSPAEIVEQLGQRNPFAMLADGLDEALIGICTRNGKEPIAAYSYEKVLQIFMDRDGMTHDDAVEFFDFNVIGAYVGPHTPCFIETE